MSSDLIDQVVSDCGKIGLTEDSEEGHYDDECNFISEPSLDSVPVEIFLKICSYLNPGFISKVLPAVCKRFDDILADDTLWRYWVSKSLENKKYPPIECSMEYFDWARECVHIDRLNTLWKDDNAMNHAVLKNVHHSSVDGIYLMKEGSICISGGRDRSLALWNVKDAMLAYKGISDEEQSPIIQPVKHKSGAHDGWVWCLAAHNTNSSTLLSGSWDSTVKIWDLPTELTCIEVFKCSLSVLCLTCIDENISVAGLYVPDIVVMDKRVGGAPVATHRVHKASVLDIVFPKLGGNMLYTTSEDHTLGSFDIRAGVLKSRKILERDTFALSIAANDDYCPHAIFAGDTSGKIHLVDKRSLKRVSVTSLWPPEKCGKITGMSMSPAALLACSEGGKIRIMNPSSPPNSIATIKSSSPGVSKIHYVNDVLAAGTCDSAVELWVPSDSTIME